MIATGCCNNTTILFVELIECELLPRHEVCVIACFLQEPALLHTSCLCFLELQFRSFPLSCFHCRLFGSFLPAFLLLLQLPFLQFLKLLLCYTSTCFFHCLMPVVFFS